MAAQAAGAVAERSGPEASFLLRALQPKAAKKQRFFPQCGDCSQARAAPCSRKPREITFLRACIGRRPPRGSAAVPFFFIFAGASYSASHGGEEAQAALRGRAAVRLLRATGAGLEDRGACACVMRVAALPPRAGLSIASAAAGGTDKLPPPSSHRRQIGLRHYSAEAYPTRRKGTPVGDFWK